MTICPGCPPPTQEACTTIGKPLVDCSAPSQQGIQRHRAKGSLACLSGGRAVARGSGSEGREPSLSLASTRAGVTDCTGMDLNDHLSRRVADGPCLF